MPVSSSPISMGRRAGKIEPVVIEFLIRPAASFPQVEQGFVRASHELLRPGQDFRFNSSRFVSTEFLRHVYNPAPS